MLQCWAAISATGSKDTFKNEEERFWLGLESPKSTMGQQLQRAELYWALCEPKAHKCIFLLTTNIFQQAKNEHQRLFGNKKNNLNWPPQPLKEDYSPGTLHHLQKSAVGSSINFFYYKTSFSCLKSLKVKSLSSNNWQRCQKIRKPTAIISICSVNTCTHLTAEGNCLGCACPH